MFQHGAPFLVLDPTRPGPADPLERVRFVPDRHDGGRFDEAWIQNLVHHNPGHLPLNEIEPAFVGLRAICRELPMAAGYVDNLLVTATGLICLVECKLWRNPQARREVVGQILDYASELATWSFEDLLAAVRKAARGEPGRALEVHEPEDILFARTLGLDPAQVPRSASDSMSLDRAEFIDAVTRSLRRGNFLLLVVGDGIRSEVRTIADLLQRRASLGFSFSLIEIAVYRPKTASGPIYVQPRILARTELVQRYLQSEALAVQAKPVRPEPRSETVSEKLFFESIGKVDPTLPPRLQNLLDRCRALGCRPTLRRALNLYVEDPQSKLWNLATIDKDAQVVFWGVAARDSEYGVAIGEAYLEAVAVLFTNCRVLKQSAKRGDWRAQVDGRTFVSLGKLLDEAERWLATLGRTADAIRRLEPVRY